MRTLNIQTVMLSAIFCTVGLCQQVMADQVLEYKLELSNDGKSYEVWMKPSAEPQPNISLSGQLTIRVPHAADFKAVNLVSGVQDADWIEASRVNAPTENPKYDYLSFSYIGAQGGSAQSYAWKKDEDLLVFSFANEKGCVEGVSIIESNDPFLPENSKLKPNNSANTNPGNQFTNLGWGAVGENNFKGVYGKALKCPK